MTEVLTLETELRDGIGKSAARALRKEGQIPAIIYGGKGDEVRITLDRNEVTKAYLKGGFASTVIELKAGNDTHKVLARELQLHPVTDQILHIDFMHISDDVTINVFVPVRFINKAESPGIKRGGILNVVRHKVELLCTASNIPTELVGDLTGLKIKDSIHISDIELPENVTPVITDRDFTVATIVGRAKEEEIVTTVVSAIGEDGEPIEEGEEGEEGAEGEEGSEGGDGGEGN